MDPLHDSLLISSETEVLTSEEPIIVSLFVVRCIVESTYCFIRLPELRHFLEFGRRTMGSKALHVKWLHVWFLSCFVFLL